MEFPKDHYNHPNKKVEWWYFAGIGEVEDIGRINYHVSFFRKFSSKRRRNIYFAHFGFNDGKEFRLRKQEDKKAGSPMPGLFIGDWDLSMFANRFVIRMEHGTSLVHLARKRPAIHGDGYYSITDMDVRGSIEGRIFKGRGWFDHECFDSSTFDLLTMQYVWVAIQLDGGVEFMLRVRPKNPPASEGTIIFPAGETQRIEPGDYCLRNGDNNGWVFEFPRYGMNFDLHKRSEDKVAGMGPDYTEGAFDVYTRGKVGQGFFEITEGC